MAVIFDCQHDSTNSFVIGRQSTNSDIGFLVSSIDVNFEKEIFLETDNDDGDLINAITALEWDDVIIS